MSGDKRDRAMWERHIVQVKIWREQAVAYWLEAQTTGDELAVERQFKIIANCDDELRRLNKLLKG